MDNQTRSTETPPPLTAVITGAGSGIGRATARAFLSAGFRVVLAGRREAELQETAAGSEAALVVPADITVPDDVERLFAAAVGAFGRIDVLFNNAGTFGPTGSIDELSIEDWNRTLAVNVTGTMLCAAAAVRHMKAQSPHGGRIINNGSVSAHTPRPLSAAYTATKHAVTGLTKAIDLDGRPFGITCGQIDIGNAATDLLAGIGGGQGALQANGTRAEEPSFPAEEAAAAVLFMASAPASANVRSLLVTAAGMPFGGRG
ncbi:SDR family oxidoreductase [Arthrobacter sp. zg-Y1171]|uniref:SDR family oxidoreductase n=1 Tax=Arthrobacter sp. zg-Y1171 TaxID=2964610 RepID=UPI0021036DD7|nr:SDR family oxidoreductase [Arthrobacter sp. zg-Y1171]MCQ1994174.1 SDR family oxidoreductase [Arthrobacter sp. zg-Y1171]UWX81725.1 SDR family oxidoreductase [Arthrobacter sp. zg-Y1171]